MRHLFSTRLRVILIIAMVLSIGLTIVSGAVNQSVPSLLVQGLLAPVRYGANALTAQAERLYGYMFHYESLEAENEALKAQIAEMEDDARKIFLAQLITREADWKNIEGLYPEEDGTEEGEKVPETEAPEAEVPEETEPEEFDPASRWKTELFEPDNPIIDTDYTMNDYDMVSEMLSAVAYFEPVIITYPCTFKASKEEEEAHFAADTRAGIELYSEYRVQVTAASE